MIALYSPVEKLQKSPSGKFEHDSSEGQPAAAVDRDDQASPAK
jgi:hypothetical protein